MLKVYKIKNAPSKMDIITQNDIYFNKYTAPVLDESAKAIIEKIDQSELLGKYVIKSKFDGMSLNIDKLSTGCKTALNIKYNPNKIFDIRECGDNALDVIYSFDEGNICCDYPLISFDMEAVQVREESNWRKIDNYEELKEWWTDED